MPGWVGFAAILLGFAGIWNTLNGMLAIGKSKVFVDEATYVFSDLRTWGWIIMFLGILQLVAAALVLATGASGPRFGIGVAGLNAIGQLYSLPAYPLWAMALFAVDILIIYGLAVYGGKRLREVARGRPSGTRRSGERRRRPPPSRARRPRRRGPGAETSTAGAENRSSNCRASSGERTSTSISKNRLRLHASRLHVPASTSSPSRTNAFAWSICG